MNRAALAAPLAGAVFSGLVGLAIPAAAAEAVTTVEFTFTGSAQYWTVPDGVTTATASRSASCSASVSRIC